MEYVKRNDVKPHIIFFKTMVEDIRDEIRKEGITFICNLVGSAKRNLVIKNANKGFDCDFQLIIKKNKNNIKEKDIKNLFMNKLNLQLISSPFSCCEDSSLAITIKHKNIKESSIINSYDVVVLRERDDCIEILKNEKESGNGPYHYIKLPDMKNHLDNFKKIKGYDMWQELREVYLNKKKKHISSDRKSFQILNEAVNEILRKYNLIKNL
jgi:hypothetical protein